MAAAGAAVGGRAEVGMAALTGDVEADASGGEAGGEAHAQGTGKVVIDALTAAVDLVDERGQSVGGHALFSR